MIQGRNSTVRKRLVLLRMLPAFVSRGL